MVARFRKPDFMRNKNLESLYYFFFYKYGKSFNPVVFAKSCQDILKSERLSAAEMVANKLGYELVIRRDLAQREYRRNLKIRINGISYALIEKKVRQARQG